MAHFEFKLPDIGEGVAEGEIVEWLVNVGDAVAEDDPMVEVMTDKATVTIGAPRAGRIADLRFGVGQVAKVGEVIVSIDQNGGAAEPVAANGTVAKPKEAQGPAATAVGDIRDGLPGSSYFQSPAAGTPVANAPRATSPIAASPVAPRSAERAAHFSAKPLATPATRKLARDMGVDLRHVPPSGPGGRTTRDDVKNFKGDSSSATTAVAVPSPAGVHAPGVHAATAPTSIGARDRRDADGAGPLEERKPFVGVRRKIAQKMQHAKNTAAHFTFVEECNVTELIALRARLKPAAEAEGVSLSYLPFIVKAVVAALKKHPILNSALDESTNELVYRRYYDIGIAAATPSGLMVPVLAGADRLSILDVAREIDRLGEGARTGTLATNELSGSTFTITSLGKQGGLFATPVLNHPEVGILGIHQMKRKPVVLGDEIVIGDVMLLSLSFDHRIVDGHIGAAFAYEIISYLENPDRLFLEMA